MAFTAQDVKTLREITGCGMMECKKALTEADGDQDKAIELLRERGLAAAAKKASRIAAEGVVKAYVDEAKKVGVVIEVNAETDFVAKNAEFQAFVDTCAKTVVEANPADVDALNACKAVGSEMTISELTTEKSRPSAKTSRSDVSLVTKVQLLPTSMQAAASALWLNSILM